MGLSNITTIEAQSTDHISSSKIIHLKALRSFIRVMIFLCINQVLLPLQRIPQPAVTQSTKSCTDIIATIRATVVDDGRLLFNLTDCSPM